MFEKGVGVQGDGRVEARKCPELRHTHTPDPSGFLKVAQIRRWQSAQLLLGSQEGEECG